METIRTVSTYAITDQQGFIEKIRAASQLRQKDEAREIKKKLNKERKRANDLDVIIKKLYESFAVGRISEERFDSLLAEYEDEQKTLMLSVDDAEQKLSAYEEDSTRLDQFFALAKKYTDFSELTTPMINEFIDKILIHAPEKVDGERTAGEPFKLICKCCGKPFESKMSNAMFCNQNCRAKFYRKKAAESQRWECTCENCGAIFTTTKKNVKYCCDDCCREANRKRQRIRNAAKEAQPANVEE